MQNADPSAVAVKSMPTLAQIEREAIESRIQAFGGNKSEAARSLGVALKTLYNKLNAWKAADAEADAQ